MGNRYFGTYETFKTPSQKEGGALMGSDNLVGDRYSIELEMEEGAHRAWVVNRFGKRIGFFEPGSSRCCAPKGWSSWRCSPTWASSGRARLAATSASAPC